MTLRPSHLIMPFQSCPPFAVTAPWQSTLTRGRRGCMALGCPAGSRSGLQSRAGTPPKNPHPLGLPVLREPRALPSLPFFTSMCPAVIHAVEVGKSPRGHASFTSRCHGAQYRAATGAVWSLPPCQHLALTLLPGTDAVHLPSAHPALPEDGAMCKAPHRADITSAQQQLLQPWQSRSVACTAASKPSLQLQRCPASCLWARSLSHPGGAPWAHSLPCPPHHVPHWPGSGTGHALPARCQLSLPPSTPSPTGHGPRSDCAS